MGTAVGRAATGCFSNRQDPQPHGSTSIDAAVVCMTASTRQVEQQSDSINAQFCAPPRLGCVRRASIHEVQKFSMPANNRVKNAAGTAFVMMQDELPAGSDLTGQQEAGGDQQKGLILPPGFCVGQVMLLLTAACASCPWCDDGDDGRELHCTALQVKSRTPSPSSSWRATAAHGWPVCICDTTYRARSPCICSPMLGTGVSIASFACSISASASAAV